MIVRTGRRIPGVVPFGGVHAPISVVRMAVGDAYGAKEWREGSGDDEVAFRTERIERSSAARSPSSRSAKPSARVRRCSAARSTRSRRLRRDAEGRDGRSGRAPRAVAYEPQLIDATFALLIASTGDPLVIPALNRDGDILSDLVLPLFGSIAGSESMLVAFESADLEPTALMAEAAHGTAPSLEGKNVANPLAMILAAAALLSQTETASTRGVRSAKPRSRRSRRAKTADLGGHASTTSSPTR